MTDMKKGICVIRNCEGTLGTGFYIGNGRIITAAHVVEKQSVLEAAFMEIDETVHQYEVKLQEKQPDTDLCILSVKADAWLEDVIMQCNFSGVLVGSSFCTYGYPGENMSRGSYIAGKVLNAHDGFQMAEYNIDLEVMEGALESYSGLSGAPVVIDGKAVGICTYQDARQLEMIEFHKYKAELERCLDLEGMQEPSCVSNMPDISDHEKYIQNPYPRSAIRSLIMDGAVNGIIIVKGRNGTGKTVWTELLSGDNRLYILGKYFIRRSDDAYSPIYRKSEEALYEWICDMAVKFGKGRVEIEHASSYGKRLKSARSIFDMLNQAMKSEGKHGLICIDGLDEFVLDAPYMFEAFCSYFAGMKLEYLHIVFTVTDEQILPGVIRNDIQENQIFELPYLNNIQVRDFLLKTLKVPGIQENVDELTEKAEGHPLYLRYLIETVKNMDKVEEVQSFIRKIPVYGGSIRTYYDFRWFEMMREEDQISCMAYLSAFRKSVERQNFLEMVPQEKRAAFDLALNKMGSLLQQGERLSFFHTSFQRYVVEKTGYLQESIHHTFAEYCKAHQETEYGVTQKLYHLSCGSNQDKKECVISCNQKWVDQCALFDVEIEEMFYDMHKVLELCCSQGNMAQLIDKLLLMQRTEIRYNDMFARFATQVALAEIALNRPKKAIHYLYRNHCFMADSESLFVCLARMVEKGRKDCAEELFQQMEASFMRKLQDRNAVSAEEITYLIRGYQLLAYADEGEDYHFYVKKLKLFNQLIFSSELDEVSESAFLQASSDYSLWSTGETVTEDRMEEYGLSMNQAFFDTWLLTVAGTANMTTLLDKREKSFEKLLDAILTNADSYEWNELYTNAYMDAVMIRREYAAKVPIDKLCLAEQWDVKSIRDENGAEVSSQKIYYLFQLYRSKGFCGERFQYGWNQGEWKGHWEEMLADGIRFVGSCYGCGLKGKEHEAAEWMKRFLMEDMFSFDMRTSFRDAYQIPEHSMEFLMIYVGQFFLILYPEDMNWFMEFILQKSDDQFGVYYESYFRIMISIAKAFLKWTPNEEAPVSILKKIYSDILMKVANRYERTAWLLQVVDLMERSGCVELAGQVYQEMLHSSMGPWWYKEAQFTLAEQLLENMKEDMIRPQLTDKVMAALDAASGGMTFERYIRTTKEDVLAILWKRRQYDSVLKYVQVQLVPEDWQASVFSDYEPTDRKNGLIGNYRVANCIFPQRLVYLIIADERVPEIYRWIFSEIFLLVERRHMADYAEVQAQILSRNGKEKKKYIERIAQILLFDTGDYYFEDLLQIYKSCLDEKDYHIIIEMIEEVTEKSIEVPEFKTDEGKRDIDTRNPDDAALIKEQKENEEIIMPGTWGTTASDKQAEYLWEEAKKEEERGNYRCASDKYKEVIRELEKGGWSVWSSSSSEKGKQAIHKIIQISDNFTNALWVLREEIIWPKYTPRWQIADELLKLVAAGLSEEETNACYQAVMGHYQEMMTVPDNLQERYKNDKYHVESEREAFFALLLQFVVLPNPYISQKSMEMLSWLVCEVGEEIDKMVEYSFFEELETAEICSSLCVKLADSRNMTLRKELEKRENLAERILKCPWMVVRGNMYLVLKSYCGRSSLLKKQCQQVESALIGETAALTNETEKQIKEEPALIPENIEILLDEKRCMPPENMRHVCKYASEESINAMWKLFGDDKYQKDLSAYGERLSAGYHNGNLRNDPWRRRWYEEINKLDYHCNNELQMIKFLNAIRRVNCHFPIKDIQALQDRKLFCIIKEIFDSRNVQKLNKVYGQEMLLAGFQAVNLENGMTEIFTLRTFAVPESMGDRDGVMAALKNHEAAYANMYPFEKTKGDTGHIKELSLNIHPGSMLGVNISSRILNHGTLLLMGISGKDIKERVSVGERRWKKHMAGWPTFLSVSGWINRDKLRLPAGYKLVTFAELEKVEKEKQWMFLDNQTNRVVFL